MNIKRYGLASLVVFAALIVMTFIIHFLPSGSGYMIKLSDLIPCVVFSLVFVLIFAKGFGNKGIKGGLWFSFWLAVLITALFFSNSGPFLLTVYSFIEFLIMGALAGLVYKP